MSDNFEIGELAVLHNANHLNEHDGSLCIILDLFSLRECMDANKMKWVEAYVCTVKILSSTSIPGSTRNNVSVQPHQIRKLKDEDLKKAENLKKYKAYKLLGGKAEVKLRSNKESAHE